jgi:hypothetical protein
MLLGIFNGDLAEGVLTFRIHDAIRNDVGTLDASFNSICTQVFYLEHH